MVTYSNTLLELDGSKFIAEKKSVKLVYVPKSIEDFLDKTNTATVLVGQKGTGKSILLSCKRFIDQERTGSIGDGKTHIFPKSVGVEEINFDGEFSVKSLIGFDIEDWEKIFVISVLYYLLCQFKEFIIEEEYLTEDYFDELKINQYLNPHSLDVSLLQFGNILDSAIDNRICYENLRDFNNLARSILIGGVIEKNKKNIFYYLDGLDQAIYKAIHRSEKNVTDSNSEIETILSFEKSFDNISSKRENNKVHLWIKAQLGFLKALHTLNEFSRSNLKVYGSIRQEAFIMMSHYQLKNAPQLKSTCKEILYSDNELIEVFEKLLSAAEIEMLDFEKFGINHLKHNKVKLEKYNNETIQQHILRHTLRNPREITYQIRAIKELFNANKLISGDSKKNTNSLKEQLSSTINTIKEDLETETLPAFPSKGLYLLIEEYKRNYIPGNSLKEEHKQIITILYRLGLIGVLKRESDDSFKQYFLEKNIYFVNANIKLPESRFYLLHPVLDPLLFANHGQDKFYYPYCIIGHGLPFIFLREEEYYIPANLLKEDLSGDLDLAKSLFSRYWNEDGALEKYNNILNTFYEDWASRILSFYLFETGEEDREKIKATFTDKLSKGNFLTIDTKKRIPIDVLRRNYKLRMIVALGLACKLFTAADVVHLYSEDYFRFKERTFFSNVKNKKLEAERALAFLSKFEQNCLHEVLSIFQKNNTSKIGSETEVKQKFTKLLAIFPRYE